MEKHAECPVNKRWGFSQICHNLQFPHGYTTPPVFSSPGFPLCSSPEIVKEPGNRKTHTQLALGLNPESM